MRIIISSNTTWNIYNFRFSLVKKLLKNGYQVFILAQKDSFCKNLEKLGCKVYNVEFQPRSISIINNVKVILKYYSITKKINPKIILNFTIKPNILGNFAVFFLKYNVINTITGLGNTFLKKNFLTLFTLILYFLSFKKSKFVFFQNADDINLFIKLGIINKKKCKIVPGSGIKINNSKLSLQKKSNNKITILFIGRMIVDKGVNELLDAAKNIKKEFTNVEIWLLGSFDKSKENIKLKNKIIEYNLNGYIKHLEFCENVSKFIVQSDCVILPSYREGLPRSLLEAAIYKRPVIATNVPGCRQLVKNNFNGFLCKSKNVNSLKDCIIKFINIDLKKKIDMGNNNFKFVKDNYDEKIVINSYLNEISRH